MVIIFVCQLTMIVHLNQLIENDFSQVKVATMSFLHELLYNSNLRLT